jgi:hypothetical protein
MQINGKLKKLKRMYSLITILSSKHQSLRSSLLLLKPKKKKKAITMMKMMKTKSSPMRTANLQQGQRAKLTPTVLKKDEPEVALQVTQDKDALKRTENLQENPEREKRIILTH